MWKHKFVYNCKLVYMSLCVCVCVLVFYTSRGNVLLMAEALFTAISVTTEQQVPKVRRRLSAAEC